MKTWTTKAVAATALMVISLLAASGAQATLSFRLSEQAVYDSEANLTWLRDANANGVMNWDDAMDWAAGLSIEGVSGWRLPVGPMAFGSNQTASEMGNMFYNVLLNNPTNYAFFQNIQSDLYWSGVSVDSSDAWLFRFDNGFQGDVGKGSVLFAWAVHDGDVEASAVPAPGTLALLGAGFLGFLGVKRSRRARA